MSHLDRTQVPGRWIVRLVVLLAGLAVALVGNFLVVGYYDIDKKSDYAYIGRHCPVAKGLSQAELERHLHQDDSIFGSEYIWIQSPPAFTGKDFAAAYRSVDTEALCFPFVGCLIPPFLTEECLGTAPR